MNIYVFSLIQLEEENIFFVCFNLNRPNTYMYTVHPCSIFNTCAGAIFTASPPTAQIQRLCFVATCTTDRHHRNYFCCPSTPTPTPTISSRAQSHQRALRPQFISRPGPIGTTERRTVYHMFVWVVFV